MTATTSIDSIINRILASLTPLTLREAEWVGDLGPDEWVTITRSKNPAYSRRPFITRGRRAYVEDVRCCGNPPQEHYLPGSQWPCAAHWYRIAERLRPLAIEVHCGGDGTVKFTRRFGPEGRLTDVDESLPTAW